MPQVRWFHVLFTIPPAPASLLALVMTVHLGLAVVWLQRHQRARRLLVVPSIAFAFAPWLLPSMAGLVTALAVHALWFAAISRLSSARSRTAIVEAVSSRPSPGTPSPRTASAFLDTTVLSVTPEANDIRTFRFARPSGVEFVAGQFLPIRLTIAGREHVRCYSLSSSPAARDYLEISVKRQGLVSTALHTLIAPGSRIAIKSPAGAFTYPAADSRPLLLLAGGIGITPLLSMLRYGVTTEPKRSITLLYSATSAPALAFRHEISRLVRQSSGANAIFAVTRGAAEPGVYPGRIDRELIQTAVPGYRDAIAMICGPQPMIDGMRTMLGDLGMPADRVRAEAFEAAVAIAGGRMARSAADATPHEIRGAKSGRSAHVEPGQTLLEAAESGGLAIESLCRAGVCGTCRTRVLEGEIDCASMTLDESDRRAGFVLACVAHLNTDCVIEA